MAEGGRYEMRGGKRVRVAEPTREHPDGSGARDADGRLIGRPPEDAAKPAKPAKPTAAPPAPVASSQGE